MENMKKKIILLLFTFATAYAVQAQTIQVEGDKRLEADISDLQTFAFASQVDDKLDAGLFFLNDLVMKGNVRQAVEAELRGLGYTKAQSSPDMIVNFRVFDKATTITGYEGMGQNYWGVDEVRDPDTITQYEVKPGTIMIHLVDAEKGQVVWQGFASGLVEGGKFVNDQAKIREAVNMIFEEFGKRANEYTRR